MKRDIRLYAQDGLGNLISSDILEIVDRKV